MPHIAIMMYPGRNDATKELLAKNLKAEMVRTMNGNPDTISVSVEDIKPENWADTVAEKIKSEDILIETEYVKKSV